ncbi:Cullin-3A isoform A [Balamuthia mandrillaris]
MSKKPKITIKPFRHQVQMDPNYAENTWKLLKGAIHKIHKQNASELSFEELYRNSYNMVLHKYGDRLYKGLQQVVDEHLKEVANDVAAANDEFFLEQLNKAWSDHKISMLMIRDILMYMDRVYVMHHNVPTVYDLGLMLFRDNIARAPRIKDRLLKTLLGLVEKERRGEVINRSLVKSITQMLIDLGVNSRNVYEEDFERHFLETSADFYRIESQEFISSNSASDYMRKVSIRINEEMDRVAHYLDSSTEPKIKDVVETELIAAHMKTLIEMEGSGCISMLKDNKFEDLQRMYNLFSRVSNGLSFMKDKISNFVRETGKALVNDPEKNENPNLYVQALLDLKEKYDRLLTGAFLNDKNFQHALNQAFEFFINLNNKSPEFISLFIDEKLKKGLKGVSEEEVEVILDKVMMLFRYIQEKDVFEKYYKQHLAKRLLLGRSVSDDAERNMIAKLKTECGYQFTSKLEGMFTDMKLSSDTMENFKNYISEVGKDALGGVDLSVHVLTTGFWPTQSAAKCNLPTEVLTCCEVFKKFYLSHHNGRRLTWQTNMGTADLKAFFGTKKHELMVSTYQMVILLLFNTADTLTFKEIRDATGIPIPDLKRNLLSLSLAKYKILKKEAEGKQVKDEDAFTFNKAFRSKLFRVRVMTVQRGESNEERTVTRLKVDEDRKHQIEAGIVRIMKARKTMEHSALIAEVTKQLSSRFMPSPIIVKKRIESLIEREYLERSKSDRKIYNYLA